MSTTQYVVDSSVIVKWISTEGEILIKQADALLQKSQSKSYTLLASELARYEVGNAILRKAFSLPQKIACLENLSALPLQYVRLSSQDAIAALELAQKYKITYYDTVFIVLAKNFSCPLITDNPKHQKRVEDVKVIPLATYK